MKKKIKRSIYIIFSIFCLCTLIFYFVSKNPSASNSPNISKNPFVSKKSKIELFDLLRNELNKNDKALSLKSWESSTSTPRVFKGIEISPFIETPEPVGVIVQGDLVNENPWKKNQTISSDIPVAGYEFLTLDFIGKSKGFRHILYAQWKKAGLDFKTNVFGRNYVLYKMAPEEEKFDFIAHSYPYYYIPPTAEKMYLQNITPAIKVQHITRFKAHKTKRYLDTKNYISIEKKIKNSISIKTSGFKVKNDQVPVSSLGIRCKIKGVAKVFILNRSYKIREMKNNGSAILGSMMPHNVGVVLDSGEVVNISFRGADQIRLYGHKNAITIDVFLYHHSEHMLNVDQSLPKEIFVNSLQGKKLAGLSKHPNLGLLRDIPSFGLSMHVSNSPYFAFPSHSKNGAFGTVIITEHADYQNPEVEQIINYGHIPADSTHPGGLADLQIPMTKSFFAVGKRYKQPLTLKGKKFDDLFQESFESSPELLTEMRKLKAKNKNVEFAVHSAGTYITKMEQVSQSLEVAKEFNSRVWIDHGSLFCNIMWRGWNKRSKFYVLPSLKKYNYQYIWANTDLGNTVFEINSILPDQPTPVLYRVPALELGNWKPYIFSAHFSSMSEIFFASKTLESLIENKGISIVHTYFAPYFLEPNFSKEGKRMKIKSYITKGLIKLKKLDHDNILDLSTIGEWGDYIKDIRNLGIKMVSGNIEIINNGTKVNGFGIYVCPFLGEVSPSISLFGANNKKILVKESDKCKYANFNLSAGKTTLILR